MIDHGAGFGVHVSHHAIIGSLSQAKFSVIRDCDFRAARFNDRLETAPKLRPEAADIFRRVDALGIKQGKIDPLSRGWPGVIERIDYPKGFWVAVCWNALWGLMALGGLVALLLGLQST